MGAATHLLTCATLTLTPATVPAHRSLTCHYVNETDDRPHQEAPQASRPTALNAPRPHHLRRQRHHGPDHWVCLKEGEHKSLWVWRDRLQPWRGE